jgi:hypothetical protein
MYQLIFIKPRPLVALNCLRIIHLFSFPSSAWERLVRSSCFAYAVGRWIIHPPRLVTASDDTLS